MSPGAQNFQYDLDGEGFVKLPILKKVKLAGMTIQEAETFLEKSYADYYVEPFVSIAVKIDGCLFLQDVLAWLRW